DVDVFDADINYGLAEICRAESGTRTLPRDMRHGPGHVGLELDMLAESVVDIGIEHVDVPAPQRVATERGEVDFPLAVAGRARIVGDQRRAALSQREGRNNCENN